MTSDRIATLLRVGVLAGIYGVAWTSLRGWGEAQDASLERALLEQVTIGHRDTTPVYVQHCRRARGGCAQRMHEIAALIDRAGAEHHVDPWLLAAIAMRESGGNPDARGSHGELGLMQLHPRSRHGAYAARRCAAAPDECTAIVVDVAAALMARSIERCGSEALGLGRYNSGRCEETAYARAVMARRERMRRGDAS